MLESLSSELSNDFTITKERQDVPKRTILIGSVKNNWLSMISNFQEVFSAILFGHVGEFWYCVLLEVFDFRSPLTFRVPYLTWRFTF